MQLIQLTVDIVKSQICATTNDEENLVFKRTITSAALQDFVQQFFLLYILHVYVKL